MSCTTSSATARSYGVKLVPGLGAAPLIVLGGAPGPGAGRIYHDP
jgi:hypothetical protein